jgi:uncharacterized protein (DUF1810 family)
MSDAFENDPFDLKRFVDAQAASYEITLSEIYAGRKRSHWMWFVFPQIDGLAASSTSKFYAIKSLEEAHAYLAHPLLAPRLHACAQAVVDIEGRSMRDVFGYPDVMKLQSSATLFASVSPADSVFAQVLDKHYAGARDERTLKLLEHLRQ